MCEAASGKSTSSRARNQKQWVNAVNFEPLRNHLLCSLNFFELGIHLLSKHFEIGMLVIRNPTMLMIRYQVRQDERFCESDAIFVNGLRSGFIERLEDPVPDVL